MYDLVWFGWVSWHINYFWLINAKSSLYIYIYIYIYIYMYDLVWLGSMAYQPL